MTTRIKPRFRCLEVDLQGRIVPPLMREGGDALPLLAPRPDGLEATAHLFDRPAAIGGRTAEPATAA